MHRLMEPLSKRSGFDRDVVARHPPSVRLQRPFGHEGRPHPFRRVRSALQARYRRLMVDIAVHSPHATEPYFHDADYTVLQGGVLHISCDHGPTVLFSPSVWRQLEERHDDKG